MFELADLRSPPNQNNDHYFCFIHVRLSSSSFVYKDNNWVRGDSESLQQMKPREAPTLKELLGLKERHKESCCAAEHKHK